MVMRKVMFAALICGLLSGFAVRADAAFVIKSHPVVAMPGAQSPAITTGSSTVVSDKLQSNDGDWPQQQYDRHYGDGSGMEARRAFFWARWGILIWPLGILAIIHGARSLSRSHGGRSDDVAGISVVLGSLEVIATIVAIVFFFAFFI